MRLLSFDNSLSGFKLFLGESGYLGGVLSIEYLTVF